MKRLWTSRGWQAWLLIPVSLFFRSVVRFRSWLFTVGILKIVSSGVPVVVVGNISVGGTGKTPIVGVLIEKLKKAGYRPGIVSRGYGAVPAKEPRLITEDTLVEWAGDEPAMLLRQTGVPVCICADRAAAVDHLVKQTDVNVVVSDDGLQHYAMHRDIEIAVIDGERMLGNGWLLPAGPLREPPARLNHVDVIAIQQTARTLRVDRAKALASLSLSPDTQVNCGSFHLDVVTLVNLHTNHRVAMSEFAQRRVHAVAGVGNPQRFFGSLRHGALNVIEHSMPDHHKYVPEDVQFDDDLPVLMTAKDAVKVREFNIDLSTMYEVNVTAVLDDDLDRAIDQALNALQ